MFGNPSGVYVADSGNNRVLFYLDTSTTATRVYGQGERLLFFLFFFFQQRSSDSFSVNTGNNTTQSLASPASVFADGNGVFIADFGNDRVLFYPGSETIWTRIYGRVASRRRSIGPGSLTQPSGVFTTANGVYIADSGNNRVLFYNDVSTIASRVYGQGECDFFNVPFLILEQADFLQLAMQITEVMLARMVCIFPLAFLRILAEHLSRIRTTTASCSFLHL